jgi:hypothetical protein
MDGTLRHRRRPAAVLLVLLIAAPIGAAAQQFVCRPIVPGDTLSRLARQLTGNPRAAYTDAFQLRDPARQMFVPKSQYGRPLSTHWEACVAIEPVTAPLAFAPIIAAAPAMAVDDPVVIPASSNVESAPQVPGPSARSRAGYVVATVGSAIVAMLLLGVAVGGSLRPRPIPPDLQRAGDEFVVAFARPLLDASANGPPILVRQRFVHHAQQLEISIAPGAGRRYPNLVDHKNNLEYDVQRVMQLLGAQVVVGDRLRAAGKWVIVPIQLNVKETGTS